MDKKTETLADYLTDHYLANKSHRLADALMRYGRVAGNQVLLGQGDAVAGGSNILAQALAGTDTPAADAYAQGQKQFKQQVHDTHYEHPYASFAAEMLGNVLPVDLAGGIFKYLATPLVRKAGQWYGTRQLAKALQKGIFNKPIVAGIMTPQRFQQMNALRQMKGMQPLPKEQIIWTPKGQKHLWERRVRNNGRSPQEVAQWQQEAFFGKSSLPFGDTKYPGVSELRAPSGDNLVIRGFLTGKEGQTIGTSVYKQAARRLKKRD